MITEQRQEIAELRAREAKIVQIALDKANKSRLECSKALRESVEVVTSVVASTSQDLAQRASLVARSRVLEMEIGQLELLVTVFSGYKDLSQLNGMDIVQAKALEYLEMHQQELARLHDATARLQKTDPVNACISMQRQRLAQTAGWTQGDSEIFEYFAENQREKCNNMVLSEAMAQVSANSSPILHFASTVLSEALSGLAHLQSRATSEISEDLSGLLGKLVDDMSRINQCHSRLPTPPVSGPNPLNFSDLFSSGKTFNATRTTSPKRRASILKRPRRASLNVAGATVVGSKRHSLSVRSPGRHKKTVKRVRFSETDNSITEPNPDPQTPSPAKVLFNSQGSLKEKDMSETNVANSASPSPEAGPLDSSPVGQNNVVSTKSRKFGTHAELRGRPGLASRSLPKIASTTSGDKENAPGAHGSPGSDNVSPP
jgi:kinesin family protein 18/19